MDAGVGSLRVRLLGGLVVEGLTDAELGSRKARTMVKVLALARGRPVPPAHLAEVLWGDAGGPANPTEQLGVLASRLRRVLGPSRLTRSDAGFTLHVDWLDVAELEALVDEAAAALREGRLAAARMASDAALELARGPLLGDDEGDWLEPDRVAAAATSARAGHLAADAALRGGDPVAAELAAVAALAQDPYDEASLRILMRAQVASGRPASALAAYAGVRARLAEDLGVSPSRETEDLHTAVLDGTVELAPAATRAPADLVERGRELSELEGHLAATRYAVRLVVVTGEAGVGKTALLRAFADRVRGTATRVLVAAADELGRDLPLQPVLDALPPAEPDPGTGSHATGAISTMPDSPTERARWFEAVLARLVATPSVLVIDDLHCADAATKEFLAWSHGRPGRLLVVAGTRSGDTVAGAAVLTLGPLGVGAVARLIRTDDAERAARVHQRSGGNPLFALALADAPGEDQLPPSVQHTVATTLSQLPSPAAELVHAAAVLDALDVDLLASILHQPALAVIDGLEAAAGIGLLVERGTGFAFRHPLVREVVATTTGAARAALLHREAARVLDDRPQRDPLAIAVHARLGGATDLAARAFVEAAAVSFARSDLAAAEEQLRASLEAAETADGRRALAQVLMVAQRLDDAAAEAERAVALAGGPAALETAGWIDYYRRRYDRARRFADEAVQRSPAGGDLRASALALGGRVRHGTGDVQGAEQHLLGALDGPPAVRSVAEVWLGLVRTHEGRPAEALELVEHALLDPDHIAHPFAPLHGRFARVLALGQQGRVDEALLACDDLRVAIERSGAAGARFPAVELNVRSWLLRGTSRIREASELSLAAIEGNGAADGSGPRSEGFAEAYWVAWLDLADGHLANGDPARAATVAERLRGLETWDGTMAWHQRHRLGLVRARLARAAGDDTSAAELAAQVEADATRRATPRYAALAHVQLALAGGDGDRARIEASLATLRRCAALELPDLLDELGARLGEGGWRREAAERRAALSAGRR